MNQSNVEATSEAAGREKRKLRKEIAIYLSPMIIIVGVFVFAPLLIILFFSFLKTGDFGQIIYSFTIDNYKELFGGGYAKIFFRSIYLAFQTNIGCIIIGFPIAYFIAIYGGKWKPLLILLIIPPISSGCMP